MTTKEVADKLVEYCRTGQYEKAYQELYAQDVDKCRISRRTMASSS